MGLSITDQPEGLALLIATRKIQSVWRAKQARKTMRERRALHQDGEGNMDADSEWIKVFDNSTGYSYWYHRETHKVTWDDPSPLPPPIPKEGLLVHPDDFIAEKPRACFPLVFPFLADTTTACLSRHTRLLVAASVRTRSLAERCAWGPMICAGSLMAMRIRGNEECEAMADGLDALRVLSGGPLPIPDLSSRRERFKMTDRLRLFRGNRRWLQRWRGGLRARLVDVEWLRVAHGHLVDVKARTCVDVAHVEEVRETCESAVPLLEWLRALFAVLTEDAEADTKEAENRTVSNGNIRVPEESENNTAEQEVQESDEEADEQEGPSATR